MTRSWSPDLLALREQERSERFENPVPVELVLVSATWEFAIDRTALLSRRRSALLVLGRAFAVWSFCTLGEPRSYSEIGRIMGGRDHSSIVNLHQIALDRGLRDPGFAATCARMQARYRTAIENGLGGDNDKPCY